MFSSPLQRAITQGMKPDGDLATELSELEDYTISSRNDAQAICEALRQLPLNRREEPASSTPLYALAGLFQDVDGGDSPAFDLLYHQGLPELIRIFDATLEHVDDIDADADDLLFVLKILAMYGSREGAERVVSAARRPLKPDAYLWHVILSPFSQGHPEGEYVFEALSDPLPSDFIAVALLDSANGAAIEGELERHPFDSEVGWERLQSWFQDRDAEHFSYVHSATAALPFVRNPPRDQLLALAMDHVDVGVQMEAAWAAGKLKREAGLKILSRFCLDVSQSSVAQRYLAELGREDLIPDETRDGSFQARAEFANWLAHPNELGQTPDELEIVDHRELAWPPDREVRPFWLIRYLLRDRTGLEDDDVSYGLVGSMTWCFFSYKMHERPPEDAYAIHCYWEMEHAGMITEVEVADASEYAGLLGQWQQGALTAATITRVAELSHELELPGRLVALATGTLDGKDGWVVLDGPRSAWYPKAEQPEDTFEGIVLKIHLGRQLLGMQDLPDRAQYLATQQTTREPWQIVEAYERFMDEAAGGDLARQAQLLGSWSLLSRHYDAYVAALAETNRAFGPQTVVEVYGRYLELARNADVSIRDEVYDAQSLLGEQFDGYVDALVACNRSDDIVPLIDLFADYWDNSVGSGQLGRAALKAGELDIAERYFLQLRDELEDSFRASEMSLLATIWHDRGETERAAELLIECMQELILEIQESEYRSDRMLFGDELQHHRATFLRLFPDGEDELDRHGIPRPGVEIAPHDDGTP